MSVKSGKRYADKRVGSVPMSNSFGLVLRGFDYEGAVWSWSDSPGELRLSKIRSNKEGRHWFRANRVRVFLDEIQREDQAKEFIEQRYLTDMNNHYIAEVREPGTCRVSGYIVKETKAKTRVKDCPEFKTRRLAESFMKSLAKRDSNA